MNNLMIDDIPNTASQQMAAEALFIQLSHERITLDGISLTTYNRPSCTRLKNENHQFFGTGGVSQNNAQYGFIPAFRNENTGVVILSKTANGDIAPIHLLEGIPNTWFNKQTATDERLALRDDISSGFVRQDVFYTREDAANAVKIFNLEET